MARMTMLAALALLVMSGCTSSGKVSPLVFCDRPTDLNGRVFTNCTPRVDDRV